MNFKPTSIPGVILVEPKVNEDERGFFVETYHEQRYLENGIREHFVQDNHSKSKYGTLRGLHAQLEKPQGKLVRAVEGEIFDVAVDVRRGSPTFGHWVGEVLSAENHRQLYVPPDFVHGFCVLSEWAQVEYKVTAFYDRDDEYGIAWNDRDVGIEWPVESPLLSDKDNALPRLREMKDRLPVYKAESWRR